MPVRTYRGIGSVWFDFADRYGNPRFPILSIWDDGEVILEASEDEQEHLHPDIEQWEYLAQVVDTNIERLRKESSGD